LTRLSRKPNRPLRFLPCRDDDNVGNLRMAGGRATQDAIGAKIIRRAIRAAALGIDPGDLSGAENPNAVTEIRRLVADQAAPLDV
jgi:hypothetical protein